MAEGSDQERTEKATPRKRSEARKKGQVAKSRELPMAVVLLGGVGFLLMAGSYSVRNLMLISSELFSRSGQIHLTQERCLSLGWEIFMKLGVAVGPLILFLVLLTLGSNIAQVGWAISTEALKPQLSRLNPAKGIKRLISLRSLMEALKSILKILIVGYVAWRTIQAEWVHLFPLNAASPWTIASRMGEVIVKIGLRTGIVLLVLAILDYFYQRWEYERSLKMTKQEVKDEHKEREGDPKVKSRIRSKQLEMIRRRMMAEVPKADVVITNPQHLAVALKYDRDSMDAPTVVAKGADFLAQKIREIARKHGVPELEDKPLAQALYRSVEIGAQIPMSLYRAVAEILAHVYRLRGVAS